MKKKIVSSENYNYIFDRETGFFARWGKTRDDDPIMSPFGPEILDIEVSTICNMGCTFCFPSKTKIMMNDKEKNIEDVKIGDIVSGANKDLDKAEQKVDQLFVRNYDGNLIEIVLEDDSILQLTSNHLVYVKDKGWIEAEFIKEKDEIIKF